MPPDRGRAGRACVACRKQKTRCYAGERPGASCLRCNTLRQSCSFTTEAEVQSPSLATPALGSVSATDARLDRLETTVNLLLKRLGDGPSTVQTRSPTPSRAPTHDNDQSSASRDRGASLDADAVAPVFILRDLAAETGAATGSNGRIADGQLSVDAEDIISAGVLAEHDAIKLISIFQEHYGRWVAFDPTSQPETLLQTIRKSPLLLCACCLISIRHFSVAAAEALAPRLFDISKSLLSSALLKTPQSFEFFQSVIILCMWSTTVGQNPLSIDSWLVSGFALQHCFSTKLFQSIVADSSKVSQSRHLLDRLRVFNHLILVHLHYCCGTRRRSIVGRHQVEKCKEILKSDHATNFEQRMVAEVNLYWIIYEQCTGSTLDLPKVQASLHEWKKQWSFVLGILSPMNLEQIALTTH
ncbi:hypothetical protein, variant [Verruconis gallopava]|uniref:Transcriptional activator of proteases prtT n=1 Tax=Verruconis gallopava TaxID=253628 RepID=A0A0D1XIF4_9PEZI|nr:hypothetical protein, variant [Verruconis gallopava]KIW02086.1 hypothetical protein, variant [Verruconis gallopava]